MNEHDRKIFKEVAIQALKSLQAKHWTAIENVINNHFEKRVEFLLPDPHALFLITAKIVIENADEGFEKWMEEGGKDIDLEQAKKHAEDIVDKIKKSKLN